MSFDPTSATAESQFNPLTAVPDSGPPLRTALELAVPVNPDQAAQAAQLSKRTGLPQDVVARNLAEVQQRTRIADLDEATKSSPVLRQQMRDRFDVAQQAHDDVAPLSSMESLLGSLKDRTLLGTAKDVGVTALKGAIGLPQSIVGLADIFTGGYAGKLVQNAGIRFADAQDILDKMYSPAQQRSNAAVQEAQGFVDTLGAMLQNPSTIATTVGESVPQMLGGAAAGRTLITLAPKIAPWLAAALGEGLMGAGSSAEQTRQESDDGLLSAKQVFASVMSGAGTALFGAVGGRTAQRLGLGDIDTVLVQRGVDAASAATLKQGFVAAIVKSGISEGIFEELPQSVQEQLWQNWATDKPLGQGVGKAAAQGMLAGLSMGSGFQAVSEAARSLQSRLDEREQKNAEATAYAAKLAEAMNAAASSKLRERNPETFRELADQMAQREDGSPNTIFIDAQVLAQAGPEAIQALPSVAAQLNDALATNSMVEIPLAEALTVAPGTPLDQVFLQNARATQDSLSLEEAKAASEQKTEFLKNESERVMQQAADQQAWQQEVEQVKAQVKGGLDAIGRFSADVNEAYATLQSQFFSAMSSRLGMTPKALFDKYQLTIASRNAGGNVLNSGLPSLPVNLEGRDIPVTQNVWDNRAGDRLVNVNPAAFDAGFARDSAYVGPQGQGGIEGRYARFAEWQRTAKSIEASTVSVRDNGLVVFGNGRHRYAFMRDQGLPQIPVSMDEDSLRNAIKFGYVDAAAGEQVLNQSATIRRGKETLDKYGLTPGKKYKTREVAAALEARQRAKYGTIAADDRSPEAVTKIAKWMQAEVEFAMDNPADSGVGWYSEKFQRALDTMAQAFPELATDKVARDTMTALIAITSDGQKVVPNFAQAMDIYGRFRTGGETEGKFTTTRGHQRQASIDNNLAVLQRLYDKMGAEAMHTYLMQEKTISELKKLAKEHGGELKSDYQAHIKMPMAAVEFGPKLGAFYANLMGAHGYLTMDRWWSRTFNRYRGTLLQAPTRQGLDRFKELLGKPEMSDDEAIAATVEPRNAYEAKGFKNGTELEKAANTIYKAAFENLEDSPFNATDRTFMLDAVNKAQKSLARKGYKLSVADIQAILWYYEKRLYGELGARQTADISYEEAAQRVVSGYAGGSGEQSVLDDTGAAQGDDGTTASRVPVGEETFDEGDVNGQLEQTGDRGGRYSSGGLAPLEGAPDVRGAAGPDPRLVAVAEQYARDNGIELKRQVEYVQVDEARAARIAQAYAEMQHAPNDPKVKEAYQNLIAQTRAQYDALVAAGYEFTFFDDTTDPYQGNPWNAMRDLRANQRMAVYGTYAGFGVGADLNIGLADPAGGANLDPNAVLAAIKDIGGDIVGSVIHQSASEPTLVVKLKNRLDDNAAATLSEKLGQEAIAQSFEDGTGQLYGPQAANWGEYSPDFFVTADGRRASETLNPLLGDTGLTWPDQNGVQHPVLANDLFRAVHDAFGHGLEGAGFRAQGEENAWQAHVRLFTGSAVAAITSETRGQNSWLNYGPYGESNRTAAVENTVFAEQKTGLLPEWAWTEGRAGDMDSGVLNQEAQPLAPNGKPSNLSPELHAMVRTPEFKAWFGDWEKHATAENPVGSLWSDPNVSKAVDSNGEPLVMYHGTDKAGFTEFNAPGGKKRGDLGIFMTPNREMAQTYVKRGRGKELSRQQVQDANENGDTLSGLYPVFANIRNPLESDFEGANWSGERQDQYVLMRNGEQLYTPDGRGYFTEDQIDEAMTQVPQGTHPSIEPAPDHYETTDSVVREAQGYNDGAIIRNVIDDGGGNSSYAGEPSDVYVAFDPAQIKALDNIGTFNPNSADIYKQGPRGTFNPESLVLTLNENADLSTFLHESGHYFLEIMADLASAPDAPPQIAADMAKTLAWFGVPDLATWNSYTLDQKRPYHEKWAESFEQYLFEGKAPSTELQPIFRQFRAFLVRVYQSLTHFLRGRNLQVNDEVRQVFDRMLATDQQIAQTEQAAGMLPDFEATNEAIEKLQARSLRDLKWTISARSKYIKALTKAAATLRKGVEEEVRAEVEAQPLYRAMNWLRKGEMTDPETGDKIKAEKGFRLATEALAEMYPESMLSRPDLTLLKGMTAKGGLHPDLVAEMFGFASGDALVRSIVSAEPIASVIEGITDQRMLERHGDVATDEAIAQAANEAVHNEARARSLATELKSQSEMLNPRQDTGRTASNGRAITVNAIAEAAKQFAKDLASRRKIKDLKSAASLHRAAEARAGKAWQEATAKGDTQGAVQAKRDQLLNNYATKALLEAQAELRKTVEFFRKVAKGNDEKIVKGGRDPDVVNAMRAILGAYDVAPRLEKNALEYMELVAKNDPAMYAVLKPVVDNAIMQAKPIGELTMEEMRGLTEELRSMWVLAKRSRQMEVDGNLLDLEDAADMLMSRMKDIGIPDRVPGEGKAITKGEEARIKLQFFKAALRRVEQWAEGIDGAFGGPFSSLVFQPIKQAADKYRTAKHDYRTRFTELVKQVGPFLPEGEIAAPELGYTFGGGKDSGMAEFLHALLHTGNDSNKRKLLLGRRWATENADGTLDTSRWDAFIQRLAAEGKLRIEHYQFAQGVWNLLEETKPLAQETHRKVFGRYFAEVTANEFVDPWGNVWRGGYVPAQTDTRLVKDQKLRELAEGENESMAYAFPGAPNGFTKSRVEYNKELLLDLRALAQHMDKVLLFAHMQGAVTDVRRLISRKDVSYALNRIDPSAYEGMLMPWLNRSARQIVETPVAGDRGLGRFAGMLRARAGMAMMMGNLSNTVQQVTGFSSAAVKVKPRLLLAAMGEFTAHPKQMKARVAEASAYMRDRMLNEVSAMNNVVEDILVNPSLLEKSQAWTQRHAYFMQSAVDNTMGPVIWTGAFNQAIEQGMSETEAVKFADGVIRQTQGSVLPEDVSRFETGNGYVRLFTQFVSYFNMMANTNATAFKQIVDGVGLKKGAGKLLYVALAGMMVPIWTAEMIAQAFRGGPDDEDGDGYLDDWLAAVFGMGTLRGLTAQIPFVGQVAQLVVNRFNDKPADDKFSLSPAVSLVESAAGAPKSVYKAIMDDGKVQTAVRDVAAAATLITGLPFYAAARPIGYAAGVSQGKIDPTSPADLARGMVTGTASPESKMK